MNKNDDKLKKQGNVFIPIGIVVMIIIFMVIFLVYSQVNIIIENVRKDLFYAANNAVLSFDVQELAYKRYAIDKNQTKQIIQEILSKNFVKENGSITKIKIIDLEVGIRQDKVNLKIQVEVTFKSVINIHGANEHNFKMHEDVEISLLNYAQGE